MLTAYLQEKAVLHTLMDVSLPWKASGDLEPNMKALIAVWLLEGRL